jgi:4-diphosphocytidyl-2-C-methyl-D-erythritol kinase
MAGVPRQHVTTRAKINLSLGILRRRQDGYHEIETIMQSVSLCDELEVELTRDGEIRIECNDPRIPTDETNLCHQAVLAMRRFAGERLGARIRLEKRIPPGSGLGGGSSNAAGVMLAVKRALDLDLENRVLEGAAARVGSDIPFMLHGGTMLGRGRGEKLTPLVSINRGWFTIVKPNVTISTAWAYANYRFGLTKHRARTNLKTVNAVLARFPATTLTFRNDLEDVVCPTYPLVSGVLSELLFERPCFASMSGSGSALYAVFESRAAAVKAAERFSVRGLFTSVAEPAKRAVDIRDSVEACGNGND